MRLVLANHTPIFGSGSGTYTAMLAEGLTRAGHEVCIVTPLAEQFSLGPDICTCSLDWQRTPFPSFTGHPLSSISYWDLDQVELEQLLLTWQNTFSILKRKWSPDIVHVQHAWIVARAAIAAECRPVVTCHGSEVDFATCHPDIARLLLPAPDRLRAVISISRYVARKKAALIPPAPLEYSLPNPYNDHLFGFKPERLPAAPFPHIGFVGRLVRYKNCDLFLECIAGLARHFPELRATIIGDGPEREVLEDLTERLGLTSIVRFLGLLPQDQLPDHYRCFDVVLIPSRNEPFVLVALESIACGTPAVVAQSGGLAELIHPPFIVGHESDNLSDLLAKILGVLREPWRLDAGFRASDYARRTYSLQEYVLRLETIYRYVSSNCCS